MKSFIKKVMAVVVILAAIVDWPVESNAVNTKAVTKCGASLFKSCAKVTRKSELEVNKATQGVKEFVNETAENPNVQSGVYRASGRAGRAVYNTTQSSEQTTSQSRLVTCYRCNGRGNVQGCDGFVYSCSQCKGTGKTFAK